MPAPIPERVKKAMEAPIKALDRLDALEAIEACRQVTDTMADVLSDVGRIRRKAVRELIAQGYTLGELAKLTGLSRNRVHQIAKGYNQAERKRRAEAKK